MDTIIFLLEDGLINIDEGIQKFKNEEYILIDVSLGNENIASLLGDRYIHISDFPSYYNARENAYKWLDSFIKRSGLTDEAKNPGLFYDGIPIWWFVDILLQEKTFLVFRLIRTLLAFLKDREGSQYCIIGNNILHPWKNKVIHDVCHKLRMIEVPFPCKTEKQRNLSNNIDTALLKNHFKYIASESTNKRTPISVVSSKINSFCRKILYLITAIIAGLILLLFSIPGVMAVYCYILMRLALYRSDKAVEIIVKESAYNILGLLATINKRIRKMSRLVFFKRNQGKVLVVQDLGDIRRRYNQRSSKISFYNPYLEGMLFEGRVVSVYYGSTKHVDLQTEIKHNNHIKLSDLMDKDIIISVYKEHEAAVEHWKKVKVNISQKMTIYGINVWEVLEENFDLAIENSLKDKLLYYKVFSYVIKHINPSKVVLYNFEGTLRPLFLAAKKMNVETVTVQQALGPYGHALDTRERCMITKDKKELRSPSPDSFCVWSQFSKENLMDYGYDSKSINIAGYLRLDTFYREKAREKRLEVLNFFSIEPGNNPFVIIFTAMYSVIGTAIITMPQYIKTLKILGELIERYDNVYILVKPWHGDSLNKLVELFIRGIKTGSDRIIFLDPKTELHNADILSVGNVLVGTMSSIYAEAIALDIETILLDFPASRYYFEDKYMDQFKCLSHCVKNTDELMQTLENIIHENRSRRSIDSSYLFGPVDGKSKERLMKIIS